LDITWYGHSCFKLAERGQITILTDPYHESIGLPSLKWKSDVVTVSHDAVGHNAIDNVKGFTHVLSNPGEFEIGGVFLQGIAMHGSEAGKRNYNVGFKTEFANGLSVLHLGDLSHIPAQSDIQVIGDVTVLLVPVGGGNGMKATMAAEVIGLIEPTYIVPMHYALPDLRIELDPVDKFLKAMGISKVNEEEVLRVTPSNLPEQPQVVLLTPQFKSTV
jgi:L-ascorbate metabolism protein UlaG (beta-lactamase superfamily)